MSCLREILVLVRNPCMILEGLEESRDHGAMQVQVRGLAGDWFPGHWSPSEGEDWISCGHLHAKHLGLGLGEGDQEQPMETEQTTDSWYVFP